MSEFKLTAKTGFGLDAPVHETWQGFSVTEIEAADISWISCSQGELERFEKTWKKLSGVSLPDKGKFLAGKEAGEGLAIFNAGAGQWFVTGLPPGGTDALSAVAAVTEQSGGWLAIRLEGSNTLSVLVKLCGIDLHPSVFPDGSCARTPFEGMAALIACEDVGAGRYLELFQRSSSRSFLDHVRHAAASTCGPETASS